MKERMNNFFLSLKNEFQKENENKEVEQNKRNGGDHL